MNRTSLLYLLAELGPIVTFFVVGRLTSFTNAVAIFMVVTAAACALAWRLERHLPVLPLLSAVFVIGGGALTLFYNAPDAIIVADTLYYLVTASALFVSFARRSLLLKRFFGPVFAMNDTGWKALTRNWAVFLLLCAIGNEIARYSLEPETWIDYRFVKTFVVIIFATAQFTVSRKYRIAGEANAWGLRNRPNRAQKSV